MQDAVRADKLSEILISPDTRLPPTPPHTEEETSDSSNADDEDEEVEIPMPPPSTAPNDILDVDKKTPDAHVPRDSRLIRLTGVHPFNVEAPLTALFNEGFLTTPELFFVRNHGTVPEFVDKDILDWNFSVEGLVEEPFVLNLRRLMSEYEQITMPITLVCAGNRRKEQNVVKKSKGFSWGPAGVSTALFTGVAMKDVIERARPRRKARYVCMEGADQLPNGNYGTDVKLNWVNDPNKGIILAYKMNGEWLRPDHGKPLRAVVPGQIGGRSVKWLKRLIITATPSDNWYHIYDNRVLPTSVSPEESANNKDWWTDERYAIHDLSPNSAIAFPAHDERLRVDAGRETYQARGYAYSGGGRRVTRVELSLDQGKTWQLAGIEYPEDRYRDVSRNLFGGRLDMSWRETCFCWCHWSLDIPVETLANAKDMVVRCMDESMCVQPRDMYWSVLGMMNNPWFRVTITKDGGQLLFEHPTQPALLPGGWMERVKKAGGDLTNGRWGERTEGEVEPKIERENGTKEILMKKDGLKREITIDELRAHDNEQDPWFVVNGEVYDGTPFLKEHPGGATSITAAAGQDASDEFMAIHSETAKAMMPTYHLGTLSPSALKNLTVGDTSTPSSAPIQPGSTFLNPRTWTAAPLTHKRRISSDTLIFTFQLAHPSQTLGLPVGQHVMIRLRDPSTRESIIRAYTPISPPSQQGTIDVLIKLYLDTPSGKMSRAINAVPLGHTVDFKGPVGKFVYHGRGRCSINGSSSNDDGRRHVSKFIMICAGSGITPIFQVFRAVMLDPEDRTRCVVLYGNRSEDDILCRAELEGLLDFNRSVGSGKGRGRDRGRGTGRAKAEIFHTLSRPSEVWTGLKGRIDTRLLQQWCAIDEKQLQEENNRDEEENDKDEKEEEDDDEDESDCSSDSSAVASEKTMILCCGPEPMEQSVHRALKDIGWKEEQILFF